MEIKVWNSGAAIAYNVSVEFFEDLQIIIGDKHKQPHEELELDKIYELSLLVYGKPSQKFKIKRN